MQITKPKFVASLVGASLAGATLPYAALVVANHGPNRKAIERQLTVTPEETAASEATIRDLGKHAGLVKVVNSRVFIDYDRQRLRDELRPVQTMDSGRDKSIWVADALAYAKRNLNSVSLQPHRISGVVGTTTLLENWTNKPLLTLACVRMKNGSADCKIIAAPKPLQ